MPPSKRGQRQDPGPSIGSSTPEAREPRRGLFQWLRSKGEKPPVSGAKLVTTPSGASSRTTKQPREDRHRDCSAPTAPGYDLPTDQEAVNPATTLWDKAYDALKKDKPKLVKDYEELLSEELKKKSLSHARPGISAADRDRCGV